MAEKQSMNIKAGQLDRELACLFGRQVVKQSRLIRLEDMALEAELVAEGARQLRERQGRPAEQRAIVQAMDEDTALALCRWIQEPESMARLISKLDQSSGAGTH